MQPAAELWRKAKRACLRIAHQAFLGPLGFGLGVRREVWDRQYGSGAWDFLYLDRELGHYAAIVDMVARLGEHPSVLDLGCGHGRLLELLAKAGVGRYVGVDLSPVAISAARSLTSSAELAAADFTTWDVDGTFDAIVFNESIYYAARPLVVVERYAAHLADAGSIITSICDYGHNLRILAALRKRYEEVDYRKVVNAEGRVWHVSAFRPRGLV